MFEKVEYLFLTERLVHVFTDHQILLFVFAPLAMEPTLGRHVVSKIQRWALFLSRFDYMVEHIEGEKDVFADILTRWTMGYRNEHTSNRSRVCSLPTTAEQVVPSLDDIEWPGMQIMRTSQAQAADKPFNLR